MDGFTQVKNKLSELSIPFEMVEHPPTFTTEQADSYIEGIDGVRTKSLFLTNKKKTAYYLLIMDDKKQLDMDAFKEKVAANRIKFCSEASLMEKMGVTPGTVSIFGLMNNIDKDIQLYIDKDIIDEPRMSFHPNDNTKTIFIDTQDMMTFIENIGYTVHIISI